jgi:hypothetical protein
MARGRQLQIMNLIADATAPWLRGGSPKAVLYALNTFARADGWSWPSLRVLGAAAGLSERATSPIVASLEHHDAIEVVHGRSYHTPNRYRIRVEVLSGLSAEATSDLSVQRSTEGASDLSTEAPSVHPTREVGSPRKRDQKITSSRTEATAEEGAQEGAKMKEPRSVAVATKPLQLEIEDTTKKREPSDHQKLIAHHAKAFAQTHGGLKPKVSAKDGKKARELLAEEGLEEAKRLVDNWFADAWRARKTPNLYQLDVNVARVAPMGPSRFDSRQPGPESGPSAWETPIEDIR